jgi:hypothetical protein
MPDYVSPGGAFSSGFSDSLLQQAALQRQAMLDDLTRRKTEQDLVMGQSLLEERRAENTAKIRDKQEASFLRKRAEMVPGDIPDASFLKEGEDLGIPVRTTPAETQVVPSQFGASATDTTGAVRFAGSPAQAAVESQKQRAQAFIDSLPDGDPRKDELKAAFEAEAAGLKVPPGFFAKQVSDTTAAVFRQNAVKGTVERLTPTGWTTWQGDVPKGAHFMTEPQPKDTSANDTAKANQVQQVREHAYTEFNKFAEPVEEQIRNINKLTSSLDLNSNMAESTIAEQVIKITAGGAGSGIRITLPEIEQVLKKTRTKWQDLEIAVRKWSLAPAADQSKASLFYTDEQKQALRDLARLYRTKATEAHKKIVDYRGQINEADDVRTINRIRTRAQEDLFGDSTSSESGTGDSLVVGGTLNGQKILAIRPKAAVK